MSWRRYGFETVKNLKSKAKNPACCSGPVTLNQCVSVNQASTVNNPQVLERQNPNKKALASPLLAGKWELLYTTSDSILGTSRPAFLRPSGPIHQYLGECDVAAPRTIARLVAIRILTHHANIRQVDDSCLQILRTFEPRTRSRGLFSIRCVSDASQFAHG